MTKWLIGGGVVVGVYYLWTRGYIAQLFNGTPNGAPTVVAAGGAGVGMTSGGQSATVYGVGQQLGHTVDAAIALVPKRAPFPITSPTPENPFTAAIKAATAAAAPTGQSPAPNLQPNRSLVPVVRGTAAATAIS